MADDPLQLVNALWVGSHDAELPDRTTLRSGQDTYPVTRAEAETSDNWLYPVPGPKAKADAARAEKAAKTAEAKAAKAAEAAEKAHAAEQKAAAAEEAAEEKAEQADANLEQAQATEHETAEQADQAATVAAVADEAGEKLVPGRATNDPANYIAIGKQPAKDTEATTFYFLKHLDGSGFDVDPDIGAERTGGDGQEIGFTYRQLVKADGNLVSYGWPEWTGRALAGVLGADVASVVSAPLTDHTLTPVGSLPYYTVDQKWSDVQERDTNCKINSVDIEFEAGKPFKVTAGLVGGGTVYVPTLALTPAREAGEPMFYPQSSIALTGMATGLKITKGKISAKRSVDDTIQTVGIAREDVVELNQDYTLDATVKYEDKLLYTNVQYNGGTAVISDLATMGFSIFQAGVPGGVNASQSIRIDLPLLEITGFKVNKLDPDGKTMFGDLSAQSVKAATFPMWARIRNLATGAFA